MTIRAHDMQGHFGKERTVEIISRKAWFPKMSRYVRDHITRCVPCIRHRRNTGKQPGLLQDIPIPLIPFAWVHCDHLGPFPTTFAKNTHILVIVDRLTKFSFLEPVRTTSAKDTVEAFQRFIDAWGVPEHVTADRGTAFRADVLTGLLRKLNIKTHFVCPRRPQGNGQVERVNGIITPLLAKLVQSGRLGGWDRVLKKVQLLLNTSLNRSTGETPIRLLCGFDPELPDRFAYSIEHPSTNRRKDPKQIRDRARERILKSFQEAKRDYDKRHVAAETLRPGDIVWVTAPRRKADGTSRKLDDKYRGPMVVTRRLDNDVYTIVSCDDSDTYSTTAHISQLRLFGHGGVNVEPVEHNQQCYDPELLDDNSFQGTESALTNPEIAAPYPQMQSKGAAALPNPPTRIPPYASPSSPTTTRNGEQDNNLPREPLRRTTRIPKPNRKYANDV